MSLKSSNPTLGRKAPSTDGVLARSEAVGLYRQLLLVRQAEEAIRAEYDKNEMKTPVHLGIGAEAISVGVCHCLPPKTQTFGTYRNHAMYLTMTGDLTGFFGELYGRVTGPGKGKAGSMHLSKPDRGLIATSAVVGTTIPVAVGAALANAYRGSDDLVAVFFGDGAVEEGVFWESLNFACLRRLRILFVCEDNGLAIHTPASERQGFRSIAEAVQGFHCYVRSGAGHDLLQVIRFTRDLLTEMAEDPKPGLLHLTYVRFLEHVGHREDFDAGYRRALTAEERERLDPVRVFEQYLRARECTPLELTAIQQGIEAQVRESLVEAQRAPFPAPEELGTDVFA